MKKNRIRLTESQLHKVIKESVKNVLKEDHYDKEVNNRFYALRSKVGDEEMVDLLYNWMSVDAVESFLLNFEKMYMEGY